MDDEHELIDIAAIRSLPRSTTAWQMSFRKAPPEADRAGMYRLLVIVSAGANTIRLMRATTEPRLQPGAVVSALADAMTQVEGDLVPARPPAVLVDDESLMDAITLPMRACGVEVKCVSSLPSIDPVMDALGQRPGLFSEHTLIGTACREAELARAAARVASVEPWRYFLEELPIGVRLDAGPPTILVVLGTLGQCHGVACYADVRSYRRATAETQRDRVPGDAIPFTGWSLLFEPACAMSASQRRAIAGRKLPVAHALFPHFRRFVSGERPGELTEEHEARRVEQTLHALVALIDECGDAIVDRQWDRSNLALPGGGEVLLEARPDLQMKEEPEPPVEDLSPFLEESTFPPNPFERELDDGMLPRLIPDEHMMLVTHVPVTYIARVAPELEAEMDGDEVPCLVIRGTKKNARVATRALSELEALVFARTIEDEREIEIIFGMQGGEHVGVVSVFGTTHDQPLLLEEIASHLGEEQTHIIVVLVGGGTRRPPSTLSRSSVVGAVRLRLEVE